jgi:hypothetical protein
MVGKSQDLKAVPAQPAGTGLVIGQPGLGAMLITVQFDDQLPLEANEIGDERTNGLLASKLETVKLPAAKDVPQLTLDQGLFAPKPASEGMLHEPLTRRAGRAPPSPTRGEGTMLATYPASLAIRASDNS